MGSRDNAWQGCEGNLFLSFALPRTSLPDDLKLESSSLYFAYLFKETLSGFGSKMWLKWPNDFYVDGKKVGGLITNLLNDKLVCGIGLNLKAAPQGFGTVDIFIEQKLLLESYFAKLNEKASWKQIFSKFELEFDKSRTFLSHSHGQIISLENAVMLSDGSIECNGQRIFSLR